MIDAQWIAEVLSYGLLRPSFVPPRPFRELRDLTRYRKSLIRARTSEINRLQKVLEDAGVKLATVATDVMGVSGREMMRALIGGSPTHRCSPIWPRRGCGRRCPRCARR